MEWRERDGVRWLEAELPGARAGFSTRALDVRDVSDRARLATALGIEPASLLRGRQVHGAEVVVHSDRLDGDEALNEADGQATDVPGLAPMVIVADCLPIALAGPRGVAMIHGGWRGLAAGIIERGVAATEAAAAAVGPGIGPCCYEVGEEVLYQFAPLGDGLASGRMLDLRAVASRLLGRAGVSLIEVSELCTRCNPELFHSHRREGERAGRQAGVAWLS